MDAMLAIVSIVIIAAITPGPNNLIVLAAAVQSGFKTALYPIFAILLGVVVKSCLVCWGVAAVIVSSPSLQSLISMMGTAYLTWLGSRLLLSTWSLSGKSNSITSKKPQLPKSFLSVFAFQFINPKSLVLITTIATELSKTYSNSKALVIQLAILLIVSSFCLIIWATFGSVLSNWINRTRVQFWFNCVMGLMLFVPAFYLLINNLLSLL